MSNDDDEKQFKKLIIWCVVLFFLICGLVWFFNRAEQAVDTGIVRYEEYQEIFHTTQQINTQLCQMRALPDKDPMFAQFSKAQRINTLQTQLTRWVEEYNAKSKMINRSLWKSTELPYQLTVTQFNCYGGN